MVAGRTRVPDLGSTPGLAMASRALLNPLGLSVCVCKVGCYSLRCPDIRG